MLAVGHSNSCMAIHTVNPDVPAPSSAFGYSLEGIPQNLPLIPGSLPQPDARPQTLAYALCDSPPGLLAYMLDAIRPNIVSQTSHSPQSTASSPGGYSPTTARSSQSPQSAVSTPVFLPGPGRSPQSSSAPHSPQSFAPADLGSPWSPTALINWTMLYWVCTLATILVSRAFANLHVQ